MTSTCRSSAIARQFSHTPHGVMVGPPAPSGPVQFSPLATIRAVVVLPTPRTPVSTKAWWMRFCAKALRRVRTRVSWPTKSSKVCGRYLRASTRYSEVPFSAWGVSGVSTASLMRGS
jgi:hypothetical protein